MNLLRKDNESVNLDLIAAIDYKDNKIYFCDTSGVYHNFLFDTKQEASDYYNKLVSNFEVKLK